jgi:hypothetical protein
MSIIEADVSDSITKFSPETHAGLVCSNGPLLAEDLLTKSMEQTAIIPRL